MGRLTETARWKRCVPRARLSIYAQDSAKSGAHCKLRASRKSFARSEKFGIGSEKFGKDYGAEGRLLTGVLMRSRAYQSGKSLGNTELPDTNGGNEWCVWVARN